MLRWEQITKIHKVIEVKPSYLCKCLIQSLQNKRQQLQLKQRGMEAIKLSTHYMEEHAEILYTSFKVSSYVMKKR